MKIYTMVAYVNRIEALLVEALSFVITLMQECKMV